MYVDRVSKFRYFLMWILLWAIGIMYYGWLCFRSKSEEEQIIVCEATFLANFAAEQSVLLSNVSHHLKKTLSTNDCIQACSERRTPLLSISNGNCQCGYSIDKHASTFLLSPSKQFSAQNTQIFLLRRNCYHTSVADDLLDDNYVGCYPTSTLLSMKEQLKYDFASKSLTDCYATCGQKRTALMGHNGLHCVCLHASQSVLDDSAPIDQCNYNYDNGRYFRVWRTGIDDPICEKKKFIAPHRDIVGLISFPGSGNSWLRHLIEQASGIYTGSVYTDRDMYNKGFFGEMYSSKEGRTLLVKDHIYPNKRFSLFDYTSVVLLVRNPFKALVSEFNRRRSQSHIGFARKEDFISSDWSSFVTSMAAEWLNTIAEVFRSGIPVRVVYYEDLVTHVYEEIEKILKWIPGAYDASRGRKHCLDRNQEGFYKRPQSDEATFFSAALVNFINHKIKEARSIILRSGCMTCKGFPPYEEDSSDPEATLGSTEDSLVSGKQVIMSINARERISNLKQL